jgi:hypothetical protein
MTDYERGYADAMNWKVQNHLEHLPGREWVGLTDEEMDEIVNRFARYELIRTVEAKLKEKNTI